MTDEHAPRLDVAVEAPEDQPLEEELSGGNWNAPVRRGTAVHRESGPWSPSVHGLLRHVRAREVDWLPEPLRFDERGREVLTFLPGHVPRYPMPDWIWADDLLRDSGRRLRQYHDACDGFDPTGRIWQQQAHEPVEVVCHNDFAPHNFVLRDRALVGVIDIDQASPGPRVWDLAYLAYRLVPMSDPANPDLPAVDRGGLPRRLTLLCGAYAAADAGGTSGVDVDAVVRSVPGRLRALADSAEARVAAQPELADHADLYRRDALWVERSMPFSPG